MVAKEAALAGWSALGSDWVERDRTATVTFRLIFAADAGVNRKPDIRLALREKAKARRGSAEAGVKLPSARPTEADLAISIRGAEKLADGATRPTAAAIATVRNIQLGARIVIASP